MTTTTPVGAAPQPMAPTDPHACCVVVMEQVTKVYQRDSVAVKALDGIDLEIFKGDFAVLVGPSGSGKTTLLNMIGGLDTPTSGRVLVAGKDIGAMNKSERSHLRLQSIGFVFQEFNLIPVLSAIENAEFVMLLQGVPADERRARAAALLKELGLEGMEHRRPAELSGGQQQRVAVARALAGEPIVVLPDEPTANLDSKAGAALMDMMRRLNEERGATFVFSTHDPMVMERAKRVIRVRDGRIESDEPPADEDRSMLIRTPMLLSLAWRNVRRSTRRSLITVLSITIGLAALTFLWAFLDGMNSEMVENTTKYFAGDAQVHVKGYHADPNLDRAIVDAAPLIDVVRRDQDVAAASVRLDGKALASHGDKSRGVLLVGVAPADERRVTSILDAVERGAPLRPADSTGAIIGADLASALGVSPGEELVLVGQAYDGSLASARVPVRGVFRTKIDEYDGYLAIMPLEAVRDFLSAPSGATAVAVRLRDRNLLDAASARLSARLGAAYEVVGWPTLLPKVSVSKRYHVVMGDVMLAVFFVIVAAGVANPVLMAVLERTREFGVMLAVGMSQARLARLVVWEAMILGAFGLVLGNVVGIGAGLYFGRVGINLSAYSAGLRTMPGLSDVLRPEVHLERSIMLSAMVFAIAGLAALYPACRSARLEVVEAIRGIATRGAVARRRSARRDRKERPARERVPVFLMMAGRSLWRNPRRTLITAGGAAFAVFAYVFLFGYYDGFGEQAIDTATRYLTGHAQVEQPEFRTNYAPELAIDQPDALVAKIRAMTGVAGVAPRVQAQAIASSATKSEGVALIGVDPAQEPNVTFIDRTVRQGTPLRVGQDRDAIIGRKLADKLDVRVGEKIVIMTQAADHELGTAAYRVAGIFATESASFDGTIVYVTLPAAQRLLALGGRVSTINIRLEDGSRLDEVTARLRPTIAATGYAIAPWQALIPSVDEMVRVLLVIRLIIMAIVIAVVVMATMNTVFMSIAERTRELGVMLALGTRPWAVIRLVLYETAATMILAAGVGYGFGISLVAYLSRAGLDLSAFFKDYDSIPGLTGIVYPRLMWASIIGPGIVLIVGSLLASIYPAGQAARLDPVKAIRHT